MHDWNKVSEVLPPLGRPVLLKKQGTNNKAKFFVTIATLRTIEIEGIITMFWEDNCKCAGSSQLVSGEDSWISIEDLEHV